jgi:hypothetical protein
VEGVGVGPAKLAPWLGFMDTKGKKEKGMAGRPLLMGLTGERKKKRKAFSIFCFFKLA